MSSPNDRGTSTGLLNPEFVERYQLEYEKNPRSRVFAPLAEAYRKMGLVDEAFRLAQAGVKMHPDFASGRVAFARILLDRKSHEEALEHLEAAVKLSPDNLLGHSLMGETLLELRRPKDALKAFKMVLFIDPSNERALTIVRKFEFLTADEYETDLFKMKPVFAGIHLDDEKENGDDEDIGVDSERTQEYSALPDDDYSSGEAAVLRQMDRAISLADAFTIRNEVEKAIETLESARRSLGPRPELNNRLAMLASRLQAADDAESDDDHDTPERIQPMVAAQKSASIRQIEHLENILQRINARRLDR